MSFGAVKTFCICPGGAWDPAGSQVIVTRESLGRIRTKTCCMGPSARVDYNLPSCPLQSRLQHIYHGQPYARVDLNPVPESTLSPPVRDFGYSLWCCKTLSSGSGAMSHRAVYLSAVSPRSASTGNCFCSLESCNVVHC